MSCAACITTCECAASTHLRHGRQLRMRAPHERSLSIARFETLCALDSRHHLQNRLVLRELHLAHRRDGEPFHGAKTPGVRERL